MNRRQSFSALALVLLASCHGAVQVGGQSSPVFVNGGFESGNANAAPQSWVVSTYLNPNPGGVTLQSPQTLAGLNLRNGGTPLTTTIAGTNQPDPSLTATASLRYCRYGSQCALVNNQGNSNNVNELSQTMTIGAGDVDPTDNQVHVRLVVAPVLQNPAAHSSNQVPYFFVQLTNATQGTTLYSNFNFANQAGVPWKSNGNAGNPILYTDWQLIDVVGTNGSMRQGDSVTLQIYAAGCSLGGHWGQVYVDGVGSTVPGLFISGSAPAQVLSGSNLMYTLNYTNGSAASETGVTVDFTMPPGTTFQSLLATGLSCTTPAIGSSGGVVTCAVGTLAAGASGSLTITVNVSAAQGTTLTQGNYDIYSGAESKLLGNVITTYVGCTNDAQCAAGNWCNESTSTCTPTLANGIAMPTDSAHTNPTLNGSCTTQAAALVCTSTVCDTTDKKCGYANNDGSCTSTNAGTVCRSGVCGSDGKCGYIVGDSGCTSTNAGTVCRSTACSVNGTCEPLGGCNVDGDCPGQWCDEATHACTALLPNGTAMPKDSAHTNPTLDGSCTTQAAMLVCASQVCDLNDKACGYLNGDGSCTAMNATTVCRSGVCGSDGACGYLVGDSGCTSTNAGTVCRSLTCSVNGTCEPSGGCNVDGDCTGGQWCNESAHACTAPLTNGTAMPKDSPHMNPTLDGSCTTQAAMLVCASQVCDTNDKACGYANGDGSCTSTNAATVCRSTVCGSDGQCGYIVGDGPCTSTNAVTVCRTQTCSTNNHCMPLGGCNVDADCTGGQWCNESMHTCTAQVPNNVKMPVDSSHMNPTLDGTCSVQAAMLVCVSGVCDMTDSKCGYANGDGSCTPMNAATVCRSMACSSDGKCVAPMGCNVDADCTGGQWCDEATSTCTDKLMNGTAIPMDPTHMTPTLDGTCRADSAMLVCVSGVCDTKDNKCGYADGDGSCTNVTATMVCRSGLCSADHRCIGSSSCHVDADCTGGTWCDEMTQQCLGKLMNGMPIPDDPMHTSPTLNAMCTMDAAMLVCTSGVCDTKDNECGYANGDGPCTAMNATTVCRSGACSSDGKCVAPMGCHVDADCMKGTWCDEATSACVAQLSNGTQIPTDPTHASPTLNGKCTTAAATLVCKSGVCDTRDNECGYANEDGPCTAANGATVCRSGACGGDGTCRPSPGCNTSADCTEPATPTCDVSNHTCVAAADMGSASSGRYLSGGAGCSATGRSGADGLLIGLVLLALLWLRERRRLVPFAVALALSLCSVARAQTQARGAAIDAFRVSPAGSDWFSLDSMDYRGRVRAAVSATLDYAHDPLVIYNSDGSRFGTPVRHQGFIDIGASIVLFERLRLQAMLPIAFYQSGSSSEADGVQLHPNHVGGLGDLRLGADVRLWGRYGRPFSVSAGGNVTFPTGSRAGDFGNGNVTGDLHVAMAGDISLFTYAVQVGFAFRRDQSIADVNFNDEVQFAVAAGVRVLKKHLLIGPELYGMGDVGHSGGHARKGDLEGDIGAHYNFDFGLRVGAGIGTGFVNSAGIPDLRVLANVGWMMPYREAKRAAPLDSDHDGIVDSEDACPNEPGVRSDVPARNGCPGDRDGDGVIDRDDQCVDVPQGDHPDPKRVGCPDKDTDGDGVYDSNDQCVDVPQGDHPDPKRVGCPDKDTDGDGVYDSNDLCPEQPAGDEPDPKRVGCPLPDRDSDRVADDVDACPDTPGAPSSDPKKNGCPGLVQVTKSQIAILKPVLFATNKDVILAGSFPVLEAVADTLRSVPDIKHLSIQGHTDAQGKPAKNLDLSDRRAKSVMRWLVEHGVDASRLDAKGFGQTRPIDTNKTAVGRAKNRRVEFVIVPDAP